MKIEEADSLLQRLFEMCSDEAMQNFRRHPISYFRTPTIVANPEHKKIASLGLKFQWVDPHNGQWKESKAQRTKLFKGNTALGIRTGMRLISTLTGTDYIDSPQAQLPNYLRFSNRQTVRKVQYDHLKQALELVDTRSRTALWPPDNTVNQNRRALQDYLQGKGSDTVFDDMDAFNANVSHPSWKRKKCDLCFSMQAVSSLLNIIHRSNNRSLTSTEQTTACDYNAGGCFRCRAYNRPCTFTSRATGPGAQGKSAVELITAGGPLEELGFVAKADRTLQNANHRQPLWEAIDPPFAAGIEEDVAEDQYDAPEPDHQAYADRD